MQKTAIGFLWAWLRHRSITQTLLVMKLTLVFLITACLAMHASGVSQSVTISGKDLSLKEVFATVKQQTGFFVFYNEVLLKDAKPVSLTVVNLPLPSLLDKVLKDQPISYRIDGKTIILSRKVLQQKGNGSGVDNLNSSFGIFPVKGHITDSDGNPLSGINVMVRGTKNGTVSDINGNFIINASAGDILLFSSIGFQSIERTISDNSPLTITLTPSITKLDDVKVVVNTGYQEISRERSTGSFAHINNKLFNRKVSTNLLDRITEVTSGLNYQPPASDQGRGTITIRGISTINASQEPLIVVDNFPYDGNIRNINPNDVLSVTVLKDAAAASIWGVRAGNGVIVITTKQGQYNKNASIQFNSNVNVIDKPDIYYAPMASSKDMVDFQKQLFATGNYNIFDDLLPVFGAFPVIPEAIELMLAKRRNDINQGQLDQALAALEKNDVRRDIDKYFLQSGINQQYSLNVSGGTNNYKYYTSLGYDKNRLTGIGNDMDRLTIRFDNTFRPIQKLDINGFVVYTHTNTQTSNVLFSFPNGGGLSPYSKLLDENNNPAAVTTTSQSIRSAYRDTASYPALLDWSYRPLDELKNADNTAQLNDIRLGAGLKYYLINGLNVEVKYQYQRSLDQTRNYYSQKTYRTRDLINSFMQGTPDNPIYAVPLGGILDLTRVTLASWNLRTQINYTKQIGQHNINALAGTEVRETVTGTTANREYGYSPENNLTTVVNYATDYTKRPDRSNQRIPYENSISGEVSRYRSYYANLSYIFREKYSLTASGRIDGSNFYGVKSNQRIVPLWSAGVGYEISKAPFYKLSWLPYLKVTMTYGFNGNTNNTAAAYTLLGYQRNGYINVNSAYLLSPANPRLQWETINMINARINFATKNARLNGSLEYYRKKSANLIAPISTFPSSGVTSFSGNNAGLKGSGIDITLNSINISSAAWRWETNFLFSTTKDEVTSYQIQPSLVADYLSNSNIPVIGKPLYKIYSYRWAGLDPTTGASRAYLDGNIAPAANVVSEATLSDIVYGGRTTPNIFGSFRNTLERYRLSLSFNITYKFGYVFRRTSVSYQNMVTSWGGHADYSKRWQKPGDENVTDVPALSFPLNSNNDVVYSQSNILVERGDHIRLQDVRIGYSFNSKIKALPQLNGEIFLYANNIGILWKANKYNIDPDYVGANFAPSRSIALGVNINL